MEANRDFQSAKKHFQRKIVHTWKICIYSQIERRDSMNTALQYYKVSKTKQSKRVLCHWRSVVILMKTHTLKLRLASFFRLRSLFFRLTAAVRCIRQQKMKELASANRRFLLSCSFGKWLHGHRALNRLEKRCNDFAASQKHRLARRTFTLLAKASRLSRCAFSVSARAAVAKQRYFFKMWKKCFEANALVSRANLFIAKVVGAQNKVALRIGWESWLQVYLNHFFLQSLFLYVDNLIFDKVYIDALRRSRFQRIDMLQSCIFSWRAFKVYSNLGYRLLLVFLNLYHV